MPKTRLHELSELGQSVWLDYISRSVLDSGKLDSLIDQGVRGITSNPSIFNKAICTSTDYDTDIRRLAEQGRTTFEIYDELTIRDIQDAADRFKPIWEQTDHTDGYISLEINPELAYETEKTIDEGIRLHEKVDRPNLMLKVPATDQGFPAVSALLARGINVNITLIFSLQQYAKTARAYCAGIEECIKEGGDAGTVQSVASVFVSRVDTLTDTIIEEKIDAAHDEDHVKELERLRGTAAIANSALIYNNFRQLIQSDRFKNLQKQGAHVQRVLWGSTSTKNPSYSDIKYITELIAKDTVNTIPEHTLQAFCDHGVVKEALTGNIDSAQRVINKLINVNIDLNEICASLLQDGVIAFQKAFTNLLASIKEKGGSR